MTPSLSVLPAGPLSFQLVDSSGKTLHVEHGPEAEEVCRIVVRLVGPCCLDRSGAEERAA